MKVNKYRNPIIIALRMEKIIREEGIELSGIIGSSNERVTQNMDLLRLVLDVKEQI